MNHDDVVEPNEVSGDALDTPGEHQPASFYPTIIPRDENHPCSAHFEVVSTGDDRGRALRAKATFLHGERVAQLSGMVVRHATLDTIQISPALHVSDPWFCRFLLHSCDPNLDIDVTTMEARAAKDIHPGEYVTIDYAATEDEIANQFACHCGSQRCRGWMMGRREKPNEAGQAFLDARSHEWWRTRRSGGQKQTTAIGNFERLRPSTGSRQCFMTFWIFRGSASTAGGGPRF